MFILVAAGIWASVTEVNEVAIAPGEVVPTGHIHEIQHLEGGVVSEIKVRNGDHVKRGDILLKFSPTASQSDYSQTLVRKASFRIEAERLQAIIDDRKPNFGEEGEQFPILAQKQTTLYQAQLLSHESELAVIDAQIRQRKTELLRSRNQAKSIKKEIRLLEEQVKIRLKLGNKLVARTEVLTTQSQLAARESERRTFSDGIIVAKSVLEEAQRRRLELIANYKRDIELQAGEVAVKSAEVRESLIRLHDRVARLDIYAPVDGIIKGLSITRINAVVDPGQVIMQLVPVGDALIVEARVSPRDIGHVHLNQGADIKVDSYDSSRFGSVRGRVKQLSASTYLDDKKNPYYLAEIGLEKSWLGDDAKKFRIIPGMTVTADIKTGSKSILDYLLRPVSRGFQSAFRER